MNLVVIDRALRKLHLCAMADVLETRIQRTQTEKVAPIGGAAIQQGYRVIHREAHTHIDETADAAIDGSAIDGSRKEYLAEFAAVPLLIGDWGKAPSATTRP